MKMYGASIDVVKVRVHFTYSCSDQTKSFEMSGTLDDSSAVNFSYSTTYL